MACFANPCHLFKPDISFSETDANFVVAKSRYFTSFCKIKKNSSLPALGLLPSWTNMTAILNSKLHAGSNQPTFFFRRTVQEGGPSQWRESLVAHPWRGRSARRAVCPVGWGPGLRLQPGQRNQLQRCTGVPRAYQAVLWSWFGPLFARWNPR